MPLGPVIGPLVICGYLVDEKNIDKLRQMGVKDSKLLTPKKREKLLPKLKRLAEDYEVIKIDAKGIDRLRNISNLNRIEIAYMCEIIARLPAEKVIIDAPERNTRRFRQKITSLMQDRNFHLVTENFADKNHIEVGAASIIAKFHRDKEIERLHKKYGFFGSGYTSDERTIEFLKDWIKNNSEFPDFVRKSWMTAMLLKEENEQKRLAEFLKNESN